MSYLGIEPEGESRTSFDFDSAVLTDEGGNENEEIVIDGRRSLEFSVDSHESIYDKWKEKVGDDIEIVVRRRDFRAKKKIVLSGLKLSFYITLNSIYYP